MSNQNSSNHIPTNEEIIEELTKDLKEQVSLETDEAVASSTCPENVDPSSSIPQDFDGSEDESEIKPCDRDDFVDDEELKQINAQLTPEQIVERRTEAANLKRQGNEAYKNGEYLESIEIYTQALRLYPLEDKTERSIIYSNRAASKINLKRKEMALEDCTKSLELNPNYVRAYLRRARLHEELEKLDESLEDYKKILELDTQNKDALQATVRLPPLINERNEKMKTEMLGKLKDLGNMILKPFGLSTNNFKMQQDPGTGSYSVNFVQNTN